MGNSLSAASESDEEAAPRPGLVLRAKRLLIAPLLLLRRLGRRKAATEEGEAEESAGHGARHTEDAEAAEAPAAPPLWRRLLPYGLVLLAGTAGGGGAIYWLSAQVIAHQAAELGERQEEAARLKGVLAGYDRMMLQNRKKLEEEQGKRAEAENRLSMAQADLARQPPASGNRGAGAQGPGRSVAGSGKSADCTLRPGSAGSTLKDCLAEFNRP